MNIQTRGYLGLISLTLSYIYYLIWVLITPFVDQNHQIQNYFPNRKYAYMIPTMIIVLVICIVTTFIGLVLIQPQRKKNSDQEEQEKKQKTN